MFFSVILLVGSVALGAHAKPTAGVLAYGGLLPAYQSVVAAPAVAPATVTTQTFRTQYHTQAKAPLIGYAAPVAVAAPAPVAIAAPAPAVALAAAPEPVAVALAAEPAPAVIPAATVTTQTYRTQYHTQSKAPLIGYALSPAAIPVAAPAAAPVALAAVPAPAPAAVVAAAPAPVPAPVAVAAAPPAYYAAPVGPATVVKTVAAVAPAAAVVTSHTNQYHSQNHLGEAAYGYSFPGQAHSAVRDFTGGVTGSYQYIDPKGEPVIVNYRADSANGFQVSSNALPVAPKVELVQPANTLVGPEPVDFTPEVKAAREEHLKLLEEAKAKAADEESEAEEKSADDASAEDQETSDGSRKKRSIAFLSSVPTAYSYHVAHAPSAVYYSAPAATVLAAPAHLPVAAAPAFYSTSVVGTDGSYISPLPLSSPYVRTTLVDADPLKPIAGKVASYSFTAGDQEAAALAKDASEEDKAEAKADDA